MNKPLTGEEFEVLKIEQGNGDGYLGTIQYHHTVDRLIATVDQLKKENTKLRSEYNHVCVAVADIDKWFKQKDQFKQENTELLEWLNSREWEND